MDEKQPLNDLSSNEIWQMRGGRNRSRKNKWTIDFLATACTIIHKERGSTTNIKYFG
jgi:hypothetical protein